MTSSVKPIKSVIRTMLPRSIVDLIRLLSRRLGMAYYAFRTGDNYRLIVNKFGEFSVAYRSQTADEDVIAHSFDKDIFFSAVPEYNPSKVHKVIDVGAHIGTFTLLAASKVHKVFAIEASRETCDFLQINVALNKLDNVVVSHLALAGESGVTVLHHDKVSGNWGHSIMKQVSQSGEEVKSISLKEYLGTHQIRRVDFIKFNCEGAEFPILMNSNTETLSKIDAMLILYHCDLAAGYSLAAMISHLENCSFRIKLFNQSPDKVRGWISAFRTH